MLKRINLTLLTVALVLGLLEGGYAIYTKINNANAIKVINHELGGN